MYAQPVGGHAGVVSVIVLCDVGHNELSARADDVDTNPLHVRQPRERVRKKERERNL